MPWFENEKTGAVRKADKSPGAGWLLVLEAKDSMTAAQVKELVKQYKAGNTNAPPGNRPSLGGSYTNSGIPGISSITDFLGMLTDKNLWLRIVKIIGGGAILLVGLAKITGADKTAGSIAGKAVKLAPLL